MTILAIDTSTHRGSVAVLADDGFIFEEDFLADRSHSSSLFTSLERAKLSAPKFDQIAIGLGPGSYAGVRIAIAAAIGLELATGAALAGLPSVAAWQTGEDRYIAIGDARRNAYYWTKVEDGLCVEGPLLLAGEELRERLRVSEAPCFSMERLPDFPNASMTLPSAKILAKLAMRKRGVVMQGELEPIYLREPYITLPKARLPLPPPPS